MADTAKVTISGTLKTTGGTALANQPITFTDSKGDVIPSATTDANGNYTTTATVVAPAPAETFTANFAGVAGSYSPSSASVTKDILAGTVLTVNIVVG